MGSIPFLVVSSAKRATEKSLAKPSCGEQAVGKAVMAGKEVCLCNTLLH